MTLVGRRGDDLYLLEHDDNGIIVDVDVAVRFPPQPMEAILRRGYWEKYSHDSEKAELLMLVPESPEVEDEDSDEDEPEKQYAPEFLFLLGQKSAARR